MDAARGWRRPGPAPHHGGILGTSSASRSQSLPAVGWRRQQWCKWKTQRGREQTGHHLDSASEDHLGQSLQLSSPSFCRSIQGFQRRLRAMVSHLALPVARRSVPCCPSRLQLFLFPHSLERPLCPIPLFLALQSLGEDLSFCPHQSGFLRSKAGDCTHWISPSI